MFSGPELLKFVSEATYVTVNDYECKLLEEKTGKPVEALAEMVEAMIVTRGASGSVIYADGQKLDIPSVKAKEVVDPTGCGDAYRAGLLYGIGTKLGWQVTGQLAAVMGSIKISSRGGQNHMATREEIQRSYRMNFQSEIW